MRESTGQKSQKSMRALANDRRRAIMDLLREGEKSVNDLAARFDVARPAISRHLRVLREAGLVGFRADHNVRYYHLRQPEIEKLHDSVSEQFQTYWTPQGGDEETHEIPGIEQRTLSWHEARISVVLPIIQHVAYSYWIDQKMFRSWVGDDAHMENRVGGTFHATSEFGGRLEGEHLALSPPNMLINRITSPLPADDNFYITRFDPLDEGTHVVLSHYVADKKMVPLLLSTWSRTLSLLKEMLS